MLSTSGTRLLLKKKTPITPLSYYCESRPQFIICSCSIIGFSKEFYLGSLASLYLIAFSSLYIQFPGKCIYYNITELHNTNTHCDTHPMNSTVDISHTACYLLQLLHPIRVIDSLLHLFEWFELHGPACIASLHKKSSSQMRYTQQ